VACDISPQFVHNLKQLSDQNISYSQDSLPEDHLELSALCDMTAPIAKTATSASIPFLIDGTVQQ
jgi:hypothetical protein